MKGMAAAGFFFAEAALVAVGVARAANGLGTLTLWFAIFVVVALFVWLACFGNTPKEH